MLTYHVDKKSIINSIDHNKIDNKIIECLEKIEDKQYSNSSEVVSATGLVNRQIIMNFLYTIWNIIYQFIYQ